MKYDAIVIGGSFAGLSAAIHIARALRTVCVIDSGRPRNRFASTSHGVFGQDGDSPLSMLEKARHQVDAYPTAQTIAGEAVSARALDTGFEVVLDSGEVLSAQKLVLAFGISDTLPELPGIAERWGKSVLHCPYCHGFEFARHELGVLYTKPMSVHQALLIADWGPTTLYLNGHQLSDLEVLQTLAKHGITIEPNAIQSLQGNDNTLSSIQMDDGRELPVKALYIAPDVKLNSTIAEQLGCIIDEGLLGPVIRTDTKKLTTVPNVYAAGDIAREPQNASWAAADGVTAGVSLHQSLVFE